MSRTLSLPLSLTLTAPAYELVPILALALLEMGETWQIHTREHGATWEWHYQGATIRLSSGDTPRHSTLEVTAEDKSTYPMLTATLRRIINTARTHDVEIYPVGSRSLNGQHADPELPSPPKLNPLLLIAPQSDPFRRLAGELYDVAAALNVNVLYPDVTQMPSGELRRTLQEVSTIVGVWESSWGRAALLQSWAQGVPALALVRDPTNVHEWQGPTLTYTQPQEAFRAALASHLKVLLGRIPLTPSTAAAPPADTAERNRVVLAPAEARDDERRRIYRRVALNKRIPLDQRFHAAQVLANAGDMVGAAQAFGSIVVAPYAGDMADQALTMLGGLEGAGQPILWQLDALTSEPLRALEIARQLVRSGDPQTALFRLERLSQHDHESIRMSALDILGEIGGLAAPRFELLSHAAADPRVRLRAARWLHAHGEAPDQVRLTLTELATQTNVPIAEEAVLALGGLRGPNAHDALIQVAQKATTGEAQLAAAEQLAARGDAATSRAVLMRVAQALPDLSGGTVIISDRVRLQAAVRLAGEGLPPVAQQAGIKVLLSLNRADVVRPLLVRLIRVPSPDALEIRRWAAQQLSDMGTEALDEMRTASQLNDEDPVIGQYLAEGLLAASPVTRDQRHAALWLATHANLPRAVEILGDIALSPRVTGSEAVEVTNDLAGFAHNWAGAARFLAKVAAESPHPAARARALDLLLREYPSELPLSMLLDLAVTGSIGLADRSPVMAQLSALARPAANRIAARLTDVEIDTDRRWQLLSLINELPTTAALPALIQLSAAAPQNPVRYAASHQLILRGQPQAGYTALAAIATTDPDDDLREKALYDLGQALPATQVLLEVILQETPYDSTYAIARQLLNRHGSIVVRANRTIDTLMAAWYRWVARLPLGWFDRFFQKRN